MTACTVCAHACACILLIVTNTACKSTLVCMVTPCLCVVTPFLADTGGVN